MSASWIFVFKKTCSDTGIDGDFEYEIQLIFTSILEPDTFSHQASISSASATLRALRAGDRMHVGKFEPPFSVSFIESERGGGERQGNQPREEQ